MTSTRFNVGLMGDKKSSRVLKPPGGGAHSDIFGIGDNEIVTPSKRRQQPQSTISSCFNMAEETNENDSKQHAIKNGEIAVNGKEQNEVDNGPDENTAPSESNEKSENEKKEIQTPVSKRVRVPPGGFSSGFW